MVPTGRFTNQYSDSYNGNVNQGWDLVKTQDLQGSLRLKRTNGVETAYYLSKGAWVPLHTGRAPGRAQLGLQLVAIANEWTHQQIQIAFDNYSVKASSVICP